MIGGYDIILDVPFQQDDFRTILADVLAQWPNAVYQDAEESGCHKLSDMLTQGDYDIAYEFFLYRDEDAFVSTEIDGVTEENEDSILYVLMDEDGITLVVDRKDTPLCRIAEQIMERIKSSRK